MTDVEDLDNLEDVENMENCVDIDNEDDCDIENEADTEKEGDCESMEPAVGMIFDGIAELRHFYHKYAKRIGFPVRQRSAKKNVNGNLRSVTFACGRGGKHDNTSQNPLKPQPSYRIGCTAYVTARLNTYLTNKYDMPFAPFVGVNHHGQSILLGCGLISKEDTETFVWLFRKWLQCMNGCAPQGIITDQARPMKNAIEIVFPNTKHRWCLWHIMKKLSEKLGRYGAYEAISSAMKRVVYDTQSPIEFDKDWNQMVDKYGLKNCEWLNELYREKSRWVPCYVKNFFWAGMSTTQRSESMNAFFDGYVHSKTSLKQFVEQYENALRDKVEKETRADADSFSKQIPTATAYMMEKQIQKVYTLSKYKEFQLELTGKMYCEIVDCWEGQGVIEYSIQESFWLEDGRMIPKLFKVSFHAEDCEVQCSCQLFVFKGILCRHGLTIFIRHGVQLLPEKYILRRWRKDVRRAHSKMKVKFNSWENTAEHLRYRELCLAFTEVADLAAQKKNEYEKMKKWIDTSLKNLQLTESSPQQEAPKTHQVMQEENNNEGNDFENVLDPVSRSRKGRARKNRIKPTSRHSKKKSTKNAQDQEVNPTQESVVSNNMPTPFQISASGVYGVQHPSVGTSIQDNVVLNSMPSPFQMSGHLQPVGGYWPAYRLHHLPPQEEAVPMYGLQQSYNSLLSHQGFPSRRQQ